MFKVNTEIYQKRTEIKDSSYMNEFYHKDFVF